MRRTKYGNRKTVVDNVTFDSTKEARRYQELKLLVAAKEILDLTLQPTIRLAVNGQKICDYRPDFYYIEAATGQRVYEDVKGLRTPAYRLKKKLVRALLDIEIAEV